MDAVRKSVKGKKRGFHVINLNALKQGKRQYFSKAPLTKKKAMAQLRAIQASKHKK